METKTKIYSAVLITVIAGLLAGCTSTPSPARNVEYSGFLKDYSRLQPGGSETNVAFYYIDHHADFAAYDKILFEPITVWVGDESSIDRISEEEIQVLIDYLDAAVREEIGKDYKLVERPGPGVIRLRVALTDGKGANVPLNAVSSVVPPGIALSVAKQVLTGTPVGVGEISLEAELQDSVSEKRLAAVVDSRVGRKVLPSANFTKWGDAKMVFDFLANRFRQRLEELRNR